MTVITLSQLKTSIVIFTPQPLRVWGIVITRGGRSGGQSGGQAVRNSAVAKKLLDEFCLFFTDMTYVPGQFMNRWFDCAQIWYGCSPGISDDLITFWDEFIKNKMTAAANKKKLTW